MKINNIIKCKLTDEDKNIADYYIERKNSLEELKLILMQDDTLLNKKVDEDIEQINNMLNTWLEQIKKIYNLQQYNTSSMYLSPKGGEIIIKREDI